MSSAILTYSPIERIAFRIGVLLTGWAQARQLAAATHRAAVRTRRIHLRERHHHAEAQRESAIAERMIGPRLW